MDGKSQKSLAGEPLRCAFLWLVDDIYNTAHTFVILLRYGEVSSNLSFLLTKTSGSKGYLDGLHTVP